MVVITFNSKFEVELNTFFLRQLKKILHLNNPNYSILIMQEM